MINDIDDGMQPMAGSIEAKDRFAVAPPVIHLQSTTLDGHGVIHLKM